MFLDIYIYIYIYIYITYALDIYFIKNLAKSYILQPLTKILAFNTKVELVV